MTHTRTTRKETRMQVITVTDAVAHILTLTADQLDQRATFTHPVGRHETCRCVTMGTVRAAIALASDDLLRANRLVGCSRIDAARITVYRMLPPVTGTVSEYANQLRALAAWKPGACSHCYSQDGHHVHCPHF